MASILGVETLQHTNGTTAITINSDGGIRLPEAEGTWTPALSTTSATDQTLSIVDSYNRQYGFYSRIGNLVYLSCDLQLGSSVSYTNGGATAQSCTIVGLPFPAKNSTGYYGTISTGYFTSFDGWSTGYTPMGYINPGESRITLTLANTNGVSQMQTTNVVVNNSRMVFNVTYITDAA